jgi:rod shape-determining protein MreC
VVVDPERDLRARLAADFGRLNFLRVMRNPDVVPLNDSDTLIGPPEPETAAAQDTEGDGT